VERVLLCSGKVYYDLLEKMEELKLDDVALVRVEQLYPLAVDRLLEIFESYPAAKELFWVQEEPRNMGAWNFIQDRLSERLPEGRRLSYVGRPRAASTATGSYKRHIKEQQTLVEQALDRSRRGVAAASGKRD
jgi:2-oxoglutarate dehydrogenase complex dehydrogenase (E1) component-like enzyme